MIIIQLLACEGWIVNYYCDGNRLGLYISGTYSTVFNESFVMFEIDSIPT